MSEGSARADKIMAPLAFKGLEPSVFNPIYEAVDGLSDQRAERLVRAILAILGAQEAQARE